MSRRLGKSKARSRLLFPTEESKAKSRIPLRTMIAVLALPCSGPSSGQNYLDHIALEASSLLRHDWPPQVPAQELECADSVDSVRSVEKLDLGLLRHSKPGIESPDLGEFVSHPFIGGYAVLVSALDHKWPGGHQA